jgi:hypothetical protein
MTVRTPRSRASRAMSLTWVAAFVISTNSCSGEPFSSGGSPSSSGGSDVGGALGMGGNSTGGAAASGGTAGTGGSEPVTTSGVCQQNSDCTVCKYDRSISSVAECYCAACETKPLTRDLCDRYRSQWERYCSQVNLICPAIACVSAPGAICSDGVCTAGPNTN